MLKIINTMGCFVMIIMIIGFSGCGDVSKDDYDKALSELTKTKSELQEAHKKITELENSSIKIPMIDTETMEKLQAAQEKGAELAAKVMSLTTENKNLTDNLAKLEEMAGSLQKKLNEFQGNTKDLPFDLLK